MAEAEVSLPDLQLVATADRDIWEPGDLIWGTLTLMNISTEHPISIQTGSPAKAKLSTLDGTPAGNNGRPNRASGRRFHLLPGATAEVRFLCSSSKLDMTVGTSLATGDYLLTAYLRIHTDEVSGRLASPAIPIRLEQH